MFHGWQASLTAIILAAPLEPDILLLVAREAKTMADALDALRRDRGTPLRARIAGLFVELRALDEKSPERSALELFDAIGTWAGDDADDIAALLAATRHERPGRRLIDL